MTKRRGYVGVDESQGYRFIITIFLYNGIQLRLQIALYIHIY